MDHQEKDITLWDIENENVITALEDFIEDWKVSHNSDLEEYLRSYTIYFKSDDATKEAIRLVLSYAKELMDGKRTTVDFYENKIWELSDGRRVRMAHYFERSSADLMRGIISGEK
ncbi:hypothetical protein [Enterococcus sp. AZ109]|uniref:hypothetical protein n=1 Tax=Enterococcus sp. AZ109 TaxID=2774634 RepID=UPI003F28869A